MLGMSGASDFNYLNKSHSKFSRRLYINYLKIAFVTSLFWILFDTFIIYNYLFDCFSKPSCPNVREESFNLITNRRGGILQKEEERKKGYLD